jgi:hypothetical protein
MGVSVNSKSDGLRDGLTEQTDRKKMKSATFQCRRTTSGDIPFIAINGFARNIYIDVLIGLKLHMRQRLS